MENKEILPKEEQIETQTPFTYVQEEIEIKKIEIEKNLYARLLKVGNKEMVDIRRFYKSYPTKRGVKISKDLFEAICRIINR